MSDFRHRALRHHAQGVAECERVFGVTIKNSDERVVPVRLIAEQHIVEDLGRVPTMDEWFRCIRPQPWMNRARRLSLELADETRSQ